MKHTKLIRVDASDIYLLDKLKGSKSYGRMIHELILLHKGINRLDICLDWLRYGNEYSLKVLMDNLSKLYMDLYKKEV